MSEKRLFTALLSFSVFGLVGAHWFYLGDMDKGKKYLWTTAISALLSPIVIGLFGILYVCIKCLMDTYRFLTMTNKEFETYVLE